MSWTKPRKVNKETEYIKLYTQVSLDINERLNIIRESENLTKTEMAMKWNFEIPENPEMDYVDKFSEIAGDINKTLNNLRRSENLTKTDMAEKWKDNEGESQMTGTYNFTLMELAKISHYINERLIFSSLEYNALEEENRILKAEIERLKS